MERTNPVAASAATAHRHRFRTAGGRIIEVDVVTCTAERWDRGPELHSGRWSVFRTPTVVEAVRVQD